MSSAYESASGSVLSFGWALQLMEAQLGLDAMIEGEPEREGIYREAVRIAADAYCHAAERPVVVDGEEVTFGYVQAIFRHLTSEHVTYVVDRLDRYPRAIRYKKAFLRTALVNAVFEMETEAANAYAVSRI